MSIIDEKLVILRTLLPGRTRALEGRILQIDERMALKSD